MGNFNKTFMNIVYLILYCLLLVGTILTIVFNGLNYTIFPFVFFFLILTTFIAYSNREKNNESNDNNQEDKQVSDINITNIVIALLWIGAVLIAIRYLNL